MENLAFHRLLRWKMIILFISRYPTYTFLFKTLGECTFWTWDSITTGVPGAEESNPLCGTDYTPIFLQWKRSTLSICVVILPARRLAALNWSHRFVQSKPWGWKDSPHSLIPNVSNRAAIELNARSSCTNRLFSGNAIRRQGRVHWIHTLNCCEWQQIRSKEAEALSQWLDRSLIITKDSFSKFPLALHATVSRLCNRHATSTYW